MIEILLGILFVVWLLMGCPIGLFRWGHPEDDR